MPAPSSPPVRRLDRAFDALAAGLVLGGAALVLLGRQALTAIGDGTYPPLATGESLVVRADYHSAQVTWGARLVAAGLAAGLAAAARHARHRRATSS